MLKTNRIISYHKHFFLTTMYSPNRSFIYGSMAPEEKQMVGKENFPWATKTFIKYTIPLDMSIAGARRFIKRQIKFMDYERQRFNVAQRDTLTPEIAAMSFLVMLGGQAKCEGQTFWIHSMKDHQALLPISDRVQAKIEAINLSHTDIMYHGLENLEGVDVRWLSLRDCPNINDWCINRIAVLFRDSLEYLDVSGCPNVSVRGLASLHKTKKLKTLVMQDLPKVEQHGELATVMISEILPHCHVAGYVSTIPPEEEEERKRLELEEEERARLEHREDTSIS